MGDDTPDTLTDNQAEILRTLQDHLDEFGNEYIRCGMIAGLLGYRGTAECPAGRIAGGVMGRMHKKGLVEKSPIGHGDNESERMSASYRPSDLGLELLGEYEGG